MKVAYTNTMMVIIKVAGYHVMKLMTLASGYNPQYLGICDSIVLLFHFAYILIEIINLAHCACWQSWSGKIDQLHYPVHFHAKTIVSTHISMLFFDICRNWCMLCSELCSIQCPPSVSKEYAFVVSHMSVTQ